MFKHFNISIYYVEKSASFLRKLEKHSILFFALKKDDKANGAVLLQPDTGPPRQDLGGD